MFFGDVGVAGEGDWDLGAVKERACFNHRRSCSLSVLGLVFSPVLKAAAGANDEKHMFPGSPGVAQCRQGEGKKERKKKRERKERKGLWYSQPPQTIPPLMCCESRRAARPWRFLNHFLQERLSTCSPGCHARRLGPW